MPFYSYGNKYFYQSFKVPPVKKNKQKKKTKCLL